MATKFIERGPIGQLALADNGGNVAPFIVDEADDLVKYRDRTNSVNRTVVNTDQAQTLTNKTLTAPVLNAPVVVSPFNTYAVDGAISVASQVAYLTKGSAGAYTLAAPGAAGIGVRITITSGSDFAHVVTFTGTTLQDGTAGANSTWTAAAVQGTSITVVGVTATKWNVESFNLGTIAP